MKFDRRALLAVGAAAFATRRASAEDEAPLFEAASFGKLATPRALGSATIETQAGEILPLEHFRGSPVILHFWATWCPPCIAEFPEVAATIAALGAEGPLVLPIAVRGDTVRSVQAFYARKSITAPIYLDPLSRTMMETGDDAALRASIVATSHGKEALPEGDASTLHAIPRTLIVNRNAEVVAEACGGMRWSADAVRKTVAALCGP